MKSIKLRNYRSGMTALDLGAGIGKSMVALSTAGFEVEGFEPSEIFREKAIERMGVNAKKLKLGVIEDIDYPSENFDFITFGAVLEHLYDPNQAILKALSWLKKDGVIHIEVPSSDWLLAAIINKIYRLMGSNYVTNLSPMHEPFHLYEFILDSFEKNAELNDYIVAYHEYYVCRLYHIPKLFHPILKWYMAKTDKGMQLAIWLKRK